MEPATAQSDPKVLKTPRITPYMWQWRGAMTGSPKPKQACRRQLSSSPLREFRKKRIQGRFFLPFVIGFSKEDRHRGTRLGVEL
jgi:hypothetical protein